MEHDDAMDNAADGVLVLSVWAEGSSRRVLGRLTMSSSDGERNGSEPVVVTAGSRGQILTAVEEWLDGIIPENDAN